MKALAQTKFCTETSSITSRHKEIQNLTNQTNTLSYSHTMTMHSARWHWLYSSEAVLQLWWSIAHCAKRGDRKFISEFLPHVYDFAVYGVGLFVSIVQLLNVYNYTSARKYRALPTSRTYMAFPLTPVCHFLVCSYDYLDVLKLPQSGCGITAVAHHLQSKHLCTYSYAARRQGCFAVLITVIATHYYLIQMSPGLCDLQRTVSRAWIQRWRQLKSLPTLLLHVQQPNDDVFCPCSALSDALSESLGRVKISTAGSDFFCV